MGAREQQPINGDPAALTMDRAAVEMRRGRAVRIVDAGRGLVVAAAETMQPALLKRLACASAGRLMLLVTAQRAKAVGLSGPLGGPVGVSFPAGTTFDALCALAGVSLGACADTSPFRADAAAGGTRAAAAAFRLAKAGRLIPALIGFEAHAAPYPGVLDLAVEEIERYSGSGRHDLRRASQARVPLAGALQCEVALFRDEHGLAEHVAVLIGAPDMGDPVPVRLHSACLTGDLLASLRCDCGEQLRSAVARIEALGGGVLLYLDQEGRGIGLPNKLRAYGLQDGGLDTVDADLHLGFLADERNYDVAAALLHELGLTRIRLLTNNPEKISALRNHGIDVVGRLPLVASRNSHNERYIRAKLERAGHLAEEPSA